MLTYEQVLLDDAGMALKRDLFSAYEDMTASMRACPDWRSSEYTRDDRMIKIYQDDLKPRIHACIDTSLEFVAHYYLLLKNKDVAITRNLQWHLLLDEMAAWRIEGVRIGFEGWIEIQQSIKLVTDLVEAIRECKHQRAVKSVRR